MNTPISQEALEQIKAALFHGQKIQAIKLHRQATDSGLAEAKVAVEKLESELRASSPEKFTVAPSGKGCMATIVMVCVIVGAVLFWTFK